MQDEDTISYSTKSDNTFEFDENSNILTENNNFDISVNSIELHKEFIDKFSNILSQILPNPNILYLDLLIEVNLIMIILNIFNKEFLH